MNGRSVRRHDPRTGGPVDGEDLAAESGRSPSGVFIRTFRGVDFAPGYPTCGDGWCDIVTKLVERVSAAAVGYPLHFTQVSEKYGVLRVYWRADASIPPRTELAIEEAIALGEARSGCTCATCAAEGHLFSSGGWLLTACSEHARGVPVPVRAGMENFHLVRRFVGEDARVIGCLYDRIHDKFVDVDPRSLGFEDQSRKRGSSPISTQRRPSGL
jgi:hypothetical protein